MFLAFTTYKVDLSVLLKGKDSTMKSPSQYALPTLMAVFSGPNKLASATAAPPPLVVVKLSQG